MSDPYDYQTNENYLNLQVADLTITLQLNFPDLTMTFDEMLIFSMVQYLSEALCELMAVRDGELDEVLNFHRRRNTGEWNREEEDPETAGKQADKSLSEKVMRSVESLRSKDDDAQPEPEPDLDEEGLKKEKCPTEGAACRPRSSPGRIRTESDPAESAV